MFTKTMRLLGATALVGGRPLRPFRLQHLQRTTILAVGMCRWTILSFGASWLMKEREKQFIPLSNGGPVDNSVYVGAPVAGGALVLATPVMVPFVREIGDASQAGILMAPSMLMTVG